MGTKNIKSRKLSQVAQPAAGPPRNPRLGPLTYGTEQELQTFLIARLFATIVLSFHYVYQNIQSKKSERVRYKVLQYQKRFR